MLNVLALLFLFLIVEQTKGYDAGVHLYQDLGCKAVTSNGKITNYDCPTLKTNNGTCRFKDKTYRIGQEVEKNLLSATPCNTGCICQETGEFTCAVMDCMYMIKKGCSHPRYSLDSCCAIDSVCGNFKTCDINGEKIREGEPYYVQEKCEECICGNPNKCRKRHCNDQLLFQSEVPRLGAPVFFKSDTCCPELWLANNGQRIVKLKDSTQDLTCQFGNTAVKHGYGFKQNVRPRSDTILVKCECTLPPLLTCTEV